MNNFLNVLKIIAFSAVVIGAINWGLVGMFHFDLVSYLFGNMTILSRIIYSLIGISGVTYLILALRDEQQECTYCNL